MKRSLWQSEDGTALMECALVMPLLVFLIFMLIQLSLVCMARQVVHYAAYSAARATLVYHPNEFGGMVGEEFVFYEKRGVAFQAACQAIAGHRLPVRTRSCAATRPKKPRPRWAPRFHGPLRAIGFENPFR